MKSMQVPVLPQSFGHGSKECTAQPSTSIAPPKKEQILLWEWCCTSRLSFLHTSEPQTWHGKKSPDSGQPEMFTKISSRWSVFLHPHSSSWEERAWATPPLTKAKSQGKISWRFPPTLLPPIVPPGGGDNEAHYLFNTRLLKKTFELTV